MKLSNLIKEYLIGVVVVTLAYIVIGFGYAIVAELVCSIIPSTNYIMRISMRLFTQDPLAVGGIISLGYVGAKLGRYLHENR